MCLRAVICSSYLLARLRRGTGACRDLRIAAITGGQVGANLMQASHEQVGKMQQALWSSGGPKLTSAQLHSMRTRLMEDLQRKAQEVGQPAFAGHY